jgi:hypothetical protein
MKKFLFFSLLFLSLAAGARTVTLPRRSNNTVYITDATKYLQAGDTVMLEGHYKWIQIRQIPGTKDSPVVFLNQGLVTIGGFVSYTAIFGGSYFKIKGNNDPEHKYGIRLGHDSLYGQFGFAFGDSKGVEVSHCEFYRLASGILQNPKEGQVMSDCYYHHNYFHDFDNKKDKGRSEALYLGNTKLSTTTFENCRIENNLIENVSGDGIQVSVGTFIIKGNVIRNYGLARLSQQRSGIIVGGLATADVIDNVIEGGKGVGLQIFGRGKMEIARNTFKNIDVSDLQKEDIIYINGKTANEENLLEIDFNNNEFINVKPSRKIIFNGTFVTNTAGISFKKNKGLHPGQLNLSKKDKFKR